MEFLIHFLTEYKEALDCVVLISIMLLQWPVFFIERVAEDDDLKNRLKIPENITLNNVVLVIFGFLSMQALATRLIDVAIAAYDAKRSLSVPGAILTVSAVLFYLFVTYLFIAFSAYAVVLYFTTKRLKIKDASEQQESNFHS